MAQKVREVGDVYLTHGQKGSIGFVTDNITALEVVGADRVNDPTLKKRVSRKRNRIKGTISPIKNGETFLNSVVRRREGIW